MTQDQFDESVSDEAIAWFTRLRSGDATADDRRQFETWRMCNPIHAQEFDKVSALWNDLDGLEAWADTVGIESIGSAERKTVSHTPVSPLLGRIHKRDLLRWGAPLVIVLFLLGGGLWLPDTLMRLTSDYYAEVGQSKRLALADGSTVYLDTGSAISVDFSQQTRRLELHQGRALFVVAADKRRPFEVAAAGGTIRALGTTFEVYKKPDHVAVTVLENAVQVSRNGSLAKLIFGQRVHYGLNTGLSAVESVDPGQVAAWRRGKLVFNNQPLGEVIDEINRYRKGAILILDQQLRTSRVSGIFDIRNPDAVLQTLEDTLPIRLHRLTRYLILLDRDKVPTPLS